MKKITFLAVTLITLISSSLLAQENKINIGIIGGPSSNFLYGNKFLKSSNALTAFSAGVIVQYNFPKIISLVSGVSYDIKGQALKGSVTDSRGMKTGTFKLKNSFNYLTIPLMVKATFGKKIGFFVEGGGFFSRLNKATSASSGIPVNNPKTDITSSFKKADAGLAFGLGINVPLGKHIVLSLEGRNNLGLLHINKLPSIDDGSVKTNSTNFLLSIAYKLGKRSA